MEKDPAREMKLRMRADLISAMKAGRGDDARLIRSLIAAIDNAEAPSIAPAGSDRDQHRFEAGTAEVRRVCLTQAQVHAILSAEIREREQAEREMERLGQVELAAALRTETALAARYLKD